MSRRHRTARWVERGLLAVGLVCLAWVGGVVLQTAAYQLEQNERLARVTPFAGTATADPDPLIGRLDVPRLGLSAVVMEGDDEKTLKVAVGHLPDTPLPWQNGNAALAGHRDTFFRPLRRVKVGDEIRLTTPHGTFQYRVTRHMVVEPDDLRVLEHSPAASLTLITCYPFNFIGPAPRRFVVHAERIGDHPGDGPTNHAS
ncbi:MAG TPA: class D sortase [Vicinamibacterales bacterium]|nr:class D sortase [Vicinamibacterales bacterium]